MTSVLSISAVTVSFGLLSALDDVSLDVDPGERHVLIGPNGAGKTTLFNLVSGAIKPDSGEVWLRGSNVTGWSEPRRAKAGLARTFQVNQLCSGLDVWDHLKLAHIRDLGPTELFQSRNLSHPELEGPTEELLHEWGMWERRHMLPSEISYGHQRLLEILLALACSPNILLLDEPTAGLSSDETSAFLSHIESLPRTVTILMIEHDVEVAMSVADQLTVLDAGRVVTSGNPEAIRNDPIVNLIYTGLEDVDD